MLMCQSWETPNLSWLLRVMELMGTLRRVASAPWMSARFDYLRRIFWRVGQLRSMLVSISMVSEC